MHDTTGTPGMGEGAGHPLRQAVSTTQNFYVNFYQNKAKHDICAQIMYHNSQDTLCMCV